MLIYQPIEVLKSVPLKYTDNHQMQVVMRKSHDEPKPITSSFWMNEWMNHLYSALLCIVVHPKRFTIIWGGLSSTTTSVQHPLGCCDGSHRTTAPVRSPHTSYRWRGERERANQVDGDYWEAMIDKGLLNNNISRRCTVSFTQAINTIMVRLIKLKYAININLTTLEGTYNPNKHNWQEKN